MCDRVIAPAPLDGGRAGHGDSSSCCCVRGAADADRADDWPSTSIGTPPCSGVKSSSATIGVRPLPMMSSKTLVGFLNSAAVRALPIEIFAPAAKVPSRRSRDMRLPPSSTMAIDAALVVLLGLGDGRGGRLLGAVEGERALLALSAPPHCRQASRSPRAQGAQVTMLRESVSIAFSMTGSAGFRGRPTRTEHVLDPGRRPSRRSWCASSGKRPVMSARTRRRPALLKRARSRDRGLEGLAAGVDGAEHDLILQHQVAHDRGRCRPRSAPCGRARR